MDITEEQLEQLVEERVAVKLQEIREKDRENFLASPEHNAFINSLDEFFNNGGDERVPFFLSNNLLLQRKIGDLLYALHKRCIFPGHPSWISERFSIASMIRREFYVAQGRQ